MVDIKHQFFLNTGAVLSEGRLTPEALSRPADRTMNTLADAKTQRLTESVDTRISVKARILNAVGSFKSSVGAVAGTDFMITSAAPKVVSIGIANPALSTAFYSSVTVRQPAAPHIVVFGLAKSANPDAVLPLTAGLVTLPFVQPNPPRQLQQEGQALAISSGNDTITGLVQSLNSLSGLRATLLQTVEGQVLLVEARPGFADAFETASIAAMRPLLQSALPSGTQLLVVSTGGVAAKHMLNELNGLPFVHSAMPINTLEFGSHITPHTPSQVRLQSEENIASLQKRVAALLREINTLIKFLATTAERGVATATASSPSDRRIAHILLVRLRKIVSRPIYGFGSAPVLPADLGIGVDAAGFLTLNENQFTWIAKNRRDMVNAIIRPCAGQDGALRTQDAPQLLAGAVHRLVYDPTHNPVIASLNGQPLTMKRDALGRPVLALRTQTQELSIVLKVEERITTDIVYGQSLLDQVTDFATAALDPNDPLMRSDSASDGQVQAVDSDAVPADIRVAAVSVQQIAQGDAARPNAIAMLPPEAVAIVVYLLWIGMFIPDVKSDREKKRRTPKPHGWRGKRPHAG